LDLKGTFSNLQPFLKIILLLGLVLFSFLLHYLLGLFLVYLLCENGINLFFSYDLSSAVSINLMKVMQLFSAVGTFVTPLLLYGYLTNFQFYFKKNFTRQSVLIVFAIMLLITPLVSFLLEWNMTIDFPEWMLKYDIDSEAIVLAFLDMNNYGDLLLNLLVMAIIPALGEELFFRGFLQQSLSKYFNNIHLAIFITSFLFSAIHLHFNGLFPRMLLGLILGYLFYWSQSLWIPIIAHFINNAMAIIISYPFFQTFDFVQSFNNYNESAIPQTNISYVLFSLLSVGLLMSLFYKNSRLAREDI